MHTPDSIERQFTLLTAAARYEELRVRDALAPAGRDGSDADEPDAVSLSAPEALELLALSEVIARKAGYGRQLAVRTARATGASWSQIGAALGTSKQSAWEAHARWIEDQAEQQRRIGDDDAWAEAARDLAGQPDEVRNA
ncbi:hypothetical protein [Micromonospora sp. CPCC 205556]|uniref:hypothetical protein n=1 Tax=Micromonospora sp. CPCC 205556 TaxID=3122398 RepID=UPI002FF29F93